MIIIKVSTIAILYYHGRLDRYTRNCTPGTVTIPLNSTVHVELLHNLHLD